MKMKLKQMKFDPTNFVSIGMLPWCCLLIIALPEIGKTFAVIIICVWNFPIKKYFATQWFHNSRIPWPRSAFRHLQYGKVVEGLEYVSDVEGREKVDRT